jgi:undecaprenyl-diphosphatase
MLVSAAMLALTGTEPVLTPVQALVLGAVQGLTELLPISSSAHLYLVPTVLGWPYAGVAFDVAMHAGTLLALVVAFLDDWLRMARDAFSRDHARRSESLALFGMIVLATIPGVIAGKLLDEAADGLRSVPLQAAMLLVFGIVLWVADRFTARAREDRLPGWGTALAVGLAQCLALVPGVSRSGITMTAGRLAGLSRFASARFSFLLSTPITLAAVVYAGLFKARDLLGHVPMNTLLLGMVSSAIFSFLAIRLMLAMVRRIGFGVFAAYRVLLALALFVWAAR